MCLMFQTNSSKWSLVFFGMSICYVIEWLVFLLLASGEEQEWAKNIPADNDQQQLLHSTSHNIQDSDDTVHT